METISLLSLDMLKKAELSYMKGGIRKDQVEVVCGCVCAGSEACTDCGAANAHRASNDK